MTDFFEEFGDACEIIFKHHGAEKGPNYATGRFETTQKDGKTFVFCKMLLGGNTMPIEQFVAKMEAMAEKIDCTVSFDDTQGDLFVILIKNG